jgi:hypothetical protein
LIVVGGSGGFIGGHLIAEVRRVERSLNTRPRKTLGYRTPLEVLTELSSP